MQYLDFSFHPEFQWLTTTLAMIGKIGASAGFSVVYQFSAELYPTVVRNAGMGSSSCMARVGGMVAPYIADFVRFIPYHNSLILHTPFDILLSVNF